MKIGTTIVKSSFEKIVLFIGYERDILSHIYEKRLKLLRFLYIVLEILRMVHSLYMRIYTKYFEMNTGTF